MLRYLNGGESHGKGLIAILEGMPAGLPLTADDINRDLARRQKGYGRGGRMRIEQDRVEFLSGVRKGVTLGTPITLHVANRDWENWKEIMAPEPGPPVMEKVVTCPRPGHADLVGAIKYNHRDIRNVLEKASARETAIGLGSYAQWDRRLTTRLAMALMSIQAMKGVEVGMGFEAARRFGSEVHDEIFYDPKTGFIRGSNNAGGLEGGITTGQPIVLRTAMKPLSTLYTPKKSVDILTKEPLEATIERSDICTVPAAGVVGEAVVAFEVAAAMVEKFGGDTLLEMRRNFDAYQAYVRDF